MIRMKMTTAATNRPSRPRVVRTRRRGTSGERTGRKPRRAVPPTTRQLLGLAFASLRLARSQLRRGNQQASAPGVGGRMTLAGRIRLAPGRGAGEGVVVAVGARSG